MAELGWFKGSEWKEEEKQDSDTFSLRKGGKSPGDGEEGRHCRGVRERRIEMMDIKWWQRTKREENHDEAWDEWGFSKKMAGDKFIIPGRKNKKKSENTSELVVLCEIHRRW